MRTQTITTIKCDGFNCKEMVEIFDAKSVPSLWYISKQVDDEGDIPRDDSSSTFAFHSLTCLEKWAKERRKVLNNNLGNKMTDYALKIKQTINAFPSEEFKSRDIQDETGIPQATVDKWLRTFVDDGMIVIASNPSDIFSPRMYKVK